MIHQPITIAAQWVRTPETQWLALNCKPARTMALAAALAGHGAWTPTWKRRKRMPRSGVWRPMVEPCFPSLVFMPAVWEHNLPTVPRLPYWLMRQPDFSLTRIPDHQLNPLRSIAEKPLLPARQLPKPGQRVRFGEGPWEGLRAKVIACTQRYATVAVEGWNQTMQVPPCQLLKI